VTERQATSDRAVLDGVAAAYARAGVPFRAQLDLTYRCELDCQHCYLDDRQTWPELTTAEWRAVVSDLAGLGALRLLWSGGEPTRRRDLDELIAHAHALGFASSMRSHAGSIDAARARSLADAGLTSIMTSVYSLDPARHDAFTRQAGSLARTLRGIAAASEAGIDARVTCVVQADTVEEIPAIAAHFASIGVEVSFSVRIYRDHRADPGLDRLQLASAQRRRAEELIWRHAPWDREAMPLVGDRVGDGPCGAGRSLVYVAPDGAVWPCPMFPMKIGHVRDQPVHRIWRDSPERKALAAFTNGDRTACQSCAGSGHCFFCPGEAFKHTGDFRQAPPHFHSRTRDMMAGFEAARGPHWSAAEWATVPEGGEPGPRPARFAFPIYRPTRGRAARQGGGAT